MREPPPTIKMIPYLARIGADVVRAPAVSGFSTGAISTSEA